MSEALWIIACMVPAGMAVTYVWRLLGVMAVAHIDPESDLLLWVRAVSIADSSMSTTLASMERSGRKPRF